MQPYLIGSGLLDAEEVLVALRRRGLRDATLADAEAFIAAADAFLRTAGGGSSPLSTFCSSHVVAAAIRSDRNAVLSAAAAAARRHARRGYPSS